MRSADFLPTAPWRRQSLVVENEAPNAPAASGGDAVGMDTLPRQVARQPSEDRMRFPSFRKPMRVPSIDDSDHRIRKPQRMPSSDGDTAKSRESSGASSKRPRRTKGFFNFRRSNKSFKSSGADTDKAVRVSEDTRRNRRSAIRGVDRALIGENRRPSGASSGEVGSTEATTDRDMEADLIIDQLPSDLVNKLDLKKSADDEDLRSQGSGRRHGKDLRGSLNLQQIFLAGSRSRLHASAGGSSRFSKSKRTSSGNNSSLLSSLSSAFSSMRGSIFLFTTSNSDRQLAEREGHSLPDIVVDDGKNLDDRLHSGSHHHEPPRFPSRHDSSSCSYTGSFCTSSCSSCLHSDNTGSCSECDGVPKRTGRRTSLCTPIAAIAEVEQEVDASSLLMVNDDLEDDIDQSLGEISLSLLRGAAVSDASEANRSGKLHRSAPVHKVGLSEEINQFLVREYSRKHRMSEPPSNLKPGSVGVRNSGNSIISKRSSGASLFSFAEELPFPVRRESVCSCATGASFTKQSKNSRVPESVPPEATVMEKRELLKRKLTFSKQQLGTVLQDVAKRSADDEQP